MLLKLKSKWRSAGKCSKEAATLATSLCDTLNDTNAGNTKAASKCSSRLLSRWISCSVWNSFSELTTALISSSRFDLRSMIFKRGRSIMDFLCSVVKRLPVKLTFSKCCRWESDPSASSCTSELVMCTVFNSGKLCRASASSSFKKLPSICSDLRAPQCRKLGSWFSGVYSTTRSVRALNSSRALEANWSRRGSLMCSSMRWSLRPWKLSPSMRSMPLFHSNSRCTDSDPNALDGSSLMSLFSSINSSTRDTLCDRMANIMLNSSSVLRRQLPINSINYVQLELQLDSLTTNNTDIATLVPVNQLQFIINTINSVLRIAISIISKHHSSKTG